MFTLYVLPMIIIVVCLIILSVFIRKYQDHIQHVEQVMREQAQAHEELYERLYIDPALLNAVKIENRLNK